MNKSLADAQLNLCPGVGDPPGQPQKNRLKRYKGSAADATSRYSKLKETLDQDLISNGNWIEVNTSNTEATSGRYFVDLFSGAGGMSVGFQQAGFKKVFSVEVDKDASDTVRKNFPGSTHFHKPIEELSAEEVREAIGDKKISVLIGGPPCNGFSVAGLRDPQDPRNRLFVDYIRILDIVRPDYFVMENVPGMVTMQKGKVFQEILSQLDSIGYKNTSARILEAAEFGAPQLRTRVVLVGNRVGKKNPYPKPLFTRTNYKTIESAIDDLKHLPFDESSNHVGTKHSTKMVKRLAEVPPGGSLYETFRDAWKRQHKGRPSMAIKENHGGVHVHYELNRVLTAREMARLQTFPDDFIFSGTFKRAYWQIGNAVPCILAKHLGFAVANALD